jgi:hypothetical protein
MPAVILGNTTTSSTAVVRLRASVGVVDPVVAVQQVTPAADVQYILMTPSAFLDTTGRYRYIPQLVVVSDAVALGVEKVLSSPGVSLTDALAHLTTKGLADSVSLSEVFLATLVFLRDFTDSVDVPDAHVIAFSKALVDNFALTEVVSRVFTKSLSSGVAMNDSFDLGDGAVFVFTKGVMNVVFAADTQTKTVTKGVTDTQVLADTLSYNFAKALADSVAAAEAISLASSKLLTDTAGAVDAAVLAFSKLADPDSVSLADAVFLSPNKAFSDMIEPADAGSLVAQSYCDITYFAEDYVGESRTFS